MESLESIKLAVKSAKAAGYTSLFVFLKTLLMGVENKLDDYGEPDTSILRDELRRVINLL